MLATICLFISSREYLHRLARILCGREASNSFIVRFPQYILLCNPSQIDFALYTKETGEKTLYIFALQDSGPESLRMILNTIIRMKAITNIILLCDKKNCWILRDFLNEFFRSLRLYFKVKLISVDHKDFISALINYLRKGKLWNEVKKCIMINSRLDFSYYAKKAIEIFERLCKEPFFMKLFKLKYWYRFFGLFQEGLPNWLKLSAFIISFLFVDIIFRKYINYFLLFVLGFIPLPIFSILNTEMLVGFIRWILYFLFLTPLISEAYYLIRKSKT
ncbi:MAG: hypothetical protein ACTSUJ_05935 [Candidatus Njordarchaeales archaeon]